MRVAYVALAAALAVPALAQDRAELKPVTMNGTWFASPTAWPTTCTGDGWIMQFTAGTKMVSVSVSQRTGSTYSAPNVTAYEIQKPVETAPAKIGLFLHNDKKGLTAGVALINNMQAEWVPAGADGAYATPAMHLRRC
jgi:hypothetical protein